MERISITTLDELERDCLEDAINDLTNGVTIARMAAQLTQTCASFGADDAERKPADKQLSSGARCMIETFKELQQYVRVTILTNILEGKSFPQSIKTLTQLSALWGRDNRLRQIAEEAKTRAEAI